MARITPAQAHYQRTTAAIEAAAATANNPLALASGYELMLAKLNADKRRLKEVQSVERKAEVKRDLLPDYLPYVQGAIEGGRGAPDDVLMTVMVWAIDARETDLALTIAEYAIRHRLPMPDQYQRTTGCLLAEEFADMELKSLAGGGAIDVEPLLRISHITEQEDMPDEVRAKLHKAIGLGLKDNPATKTAALVHLRRAFELHDKAGVKKEIEVLERDLRKEQTAPA